MSDTQFGRYEIKSELGRGGMATVFHAYDPRFERDVAIKVLPREFLHDPQFRARFEREAKTIALLEHPAIVPVYDFGEENGQPYIVMRYMSGGSLAERLQAGPIPYQDVAEILSRLAPALDVAHRKGVIHRDLKPGNILFDQYGNAYISDFGIARLKQSSGATLTGTAILGTPAYMSPEQVQGDKEIDGRSDIYALGVMFFQMLTGAVPYQATTPAKVMMMHLLQPVPQIGNIKQDLPPSFAAITERSMAKDPDHRYQNARDMAEAAKDAAASYIPSLEPATRIAAGATLVGGRPMEADQTPGSGSPPPAVVKSAPRSAGMSSGKIILGAIVVLGIFGVLVLIAGAIFLPPLFAQASATPLPTTAVAQVIPATDTAAPTQPEASPTTEASSTPKPTETEPALTDAPTETAIPSDTPAPTETAVPEIPALGGADKIALFDGNNNIWVMNIDGSDALQLTSDDTFKNNLQWRQDGSALVYISGNCAKTVNISTSRVDDIACFDAANPNELYEFRISPDESLVAVSFYTQLYIVPFDPDQLANTRKLSDLAASAICGTMGPYASNTGTPIAVKWAQWRDDMSAIALNLLGVDGSLRVDMIDVIDISTCASATTRLDIFPATRFDIAGYPANPTFENFTWDGEYLFALVGGRIRNGGFADIYLYNTELHKGQKINPLGEATCCYRDPSWSPDGRYLTFAFQDILLGTTSVTEIYLVQYGSLGTGATYIPIPMPDGFFTNQKDRPLPVLRPKQ